ncbi:hypothetical protein PROCOU_17219 [Listeria rocourtiae FSL F6-920]|nr:hypothetical protein PROCOU_17219 [Listeria rocourtiae FSL F6-920]
MKFSRSWLRRRQFHCIQLHIEVLKKHNTLFENHNKARSGGASRDAIRGLHARFALMHIEVLKKQRTLFKNHNKAGSGGALRDAVQGLHARFALMHIKALNRQKAS